MQRRVLVGAGVAVLALVGLLVGRSAMRHQAGHAVDQGLDQLVARLPPGTAIRHGATGYNPLTSTLTVHDVVASRDGVTLWTADLVTASGADGQALQQVFDPAAYPGGHPAWTDRRTLIADASADGVHIMGRDGDVVLRTVSLHRLSGRPFVLPPTPENRANPVFAADAGLALSLDTLDVRDAVMTSQIKAHGLLKLGSAAVSNYDGGKLGSLSVKRIALDGDGKPRGMAFHLAVDGIALKSADLRRVLEAIRRTGHADRSQLGGMSYDSGDVTNIVLDVMQGPHVAMTEFHASQPAAGFGPVSGRGWMHGLTLALGQAPIPPKVAPAIAAFGMTAITLDIDATSTTADQGHQATLHEDIVMRDLGKLHLDGGFSGYDAALASPTQPLAAVLGTTLAQAKVVYEDGSLVNRIMAVAAAQTHSTPDLVRAQLAMPIVALGLMLPDQPDAADQVTAFLNHPDTLTLTMNPPQKLTLAQVAQAPVPARAHLLGLHIAAR